MSRTFTESRQLIPWSGFNSSKQKWYCFCGFCSTKSHDQASSISVRYVTESISQHMQLWSWVVILSSQSWRKGGWLTEWTDEWWMDFLKDFVDFFWFLLKPKAKFRRYNAGEHLSESRASTEATYKKPPKKNTNKKMQTKYGWVTTSDWGKLVHHRVIIHRLPSTSIQIIFILF